MRERGGGPAWQWRRLLKTVCARLLRGLSRALPASRVVRGLLVALSGRACPSISCPSGPTPRHIQTDARYYRTTRLDDSRGSLPPPRRSPFRLRAAFTPTSRPLVTRRPIDARPFSRKFTIIPERAARSPKHRYVETRGIRSGAPSSKRAAPRRVNVRAVSLSCTSR